MCKEWRNRCSCVLARDTMWVEGMIGWNRDRGMGFPKESRGFVTIHVEQRSR